MRIFIHRGSRTFGPYTPSQINQALAVGTVHPTDLASRDGGNQQVPLSQLLGFTVGAHDQPPPQRRQVGCCGWIVLGGLALLVIGVIGGMIVGDSGRWDNSRMASGTLTIKVTPVDRPRTVGSDVAKKVYDVAHDHPELQRITINVDFYPVLMSDKYGHEAKGPMRMGTITVSDLGEARRYTIDGAYMRENEGAFAEQVSHMEYAGYLTM